MQATDRVRRLRDWVLAHPDIHRDHADILWMRSWTETAGEPWILVRRAHATAAVLLGLPVEIANDELLVGRFPTVGLSPQESEEMDRLRDQCESYSAPVLGQRAHMAIDYGKLLRLGLSGIRSEIAGYRAGLDISTPNDLEHDAFYRSCIIALDGLSAFSQRYALLAENLAASCDDPPRKIELERISDVCRSVPEQPASSFYEALECIHLVTFALCAGQRMLLFQLGRPDRYLLPYYKRDLARGRITPQAAQELIDCLCLKLNAYTPRGLAVGFMIGGRNGDGSDITNALSRMMLDSIEHTRLAYPGIGLCWNADTPQDVQHRASELLSQGLTHPAIFNDDVITSGLEMNGLPLSEACLYTHSTCVEITPVASSNVYVASPYVNLVQLLHDLIGVPSLNDVAGSGPVGGGAIATKGRSSAEGSSLDVLFPTFADLLLAYGRHLAETIRDAVVDENTCQMTRRYNGGWPLLSCFVNDCLSKGCDIDHGGARYNWVEPSFVGLSNLIDSLVVIRQHVYTDNRLPLDDLARILGADYDGQEDLRLEFLNLAKYGNDDDDVDSLAVQLTDMIRGECARYRTYLGGRFVPGFFCWVMHERLGAQTAASADGRQAGTALGDGSGPAQGRERLGPTAALLSATKWDHAPMLGGIAVNLKFARPRDPAGFAKSLVSLIQTYLERGGFELQINVIDSQTLRAARENPEAYRDLLVRIGGYSDYFVGLSPRMQEEVIMRTEHSG